jgi:hypothetical protein
MMRTDLTPFIGAAMRRLDRYDIIGLTVLTLTVAMWVAHFVLPPAPPLPPDDAAPGIGAPGAGVGGGIGGPALGR